MTHQHQDPKFSIIIATRLRVKLLKDCLESVRREFSGESYEIIIAQNGVDPLTKDFLNEFSKPNETFFVVDPKEANGNARNRAMRVAQGKYFFFLDDDAYLPKGYFKRVEHIISSNPKLQVFGGPDLTPPEATDFERAAGCTLASIFGTAHTHKRHSRYKKPIINATEKNLTLCNLWMNAEIFKVEKYAFHRTIERNEENILLSELAIAAKSMHAYPELFVYHKRRSDLLQFFRQQTASGLARFKSFIIHPKTFHPLFLAPALFYIYSVCLLVFSASTGSLPGFLLMSPLIFYSIFLVFFSLATLKRGLSEGLPLVKGLTYIPMIFIIIHLSYAFGTINGFIKSFVEWDNLLEKTTEPAS